MTRMGRRHPSYGGALRTTLQATAAAYGYTLTTGTTLAVLVSTHGVPRTPEGALFAFGGLIAFAALEALAVALRPTDTPSPQPFPFSGALNVAAVAVALAAAAGLAHAVGTRAAWLLAPMASTALYMLCVAAQLRFIERMYRRRGA
jgi:hypothetical protein